MKRLFAILVIAMAGAAVAASTPMYIKNAVSDSARPQADTKRDADRKPDAMLEFAGIKPGMKVMDLMPGGGYFTRLFAKAVGPNGYVYSFEPNEMAKFATDKGKQPAILAVAKDYPNVSVITAPINKITAPEQLDLVWTSQNYHDMHDSFMGPADIAAVNKAIYAALRPGGLYIVLDHSAEKGSGLRDTDTLHRIDEAAVKKEVEAAGFKLIGESNVLRNPKDDRKLKVFDPAIRGHTDQFILKFRKPVKTAPAAH
ncbi:MAG: class I SAM-dependent methyltransferase [Alphaproteobacteria bacterium]|nr:class I SAM-dependent methyltransferase [Alphaproteobacteria bacterium]